MDSIVLTNGMRVSPAVEIDGHTFYQSEDVGHFVSTARFIQAINIFHAINNGITPDLLKESLEAALSSLVVRDGILDVVKTASILETLKWKASFTDMSLYYDLYAACTYFKDDDVSLSLTSAEMEYRIALLKKKAELPKLGTITHFPSILGYFQHPILILSETEISRQIANSEGMILFLKNLITAKT